MKLKLTILFSTVLTSVLPAPHPVPQNAAPGPFAGIGSLIQRLQNSLYERSASLQQQSPAAKAQNTGNETLVRLSLPSLNLGASTTTTTTTTSTTTPRPVPVTNAFDSINAILDNINRGNNNNINNIDNNNILGNPQRSLLDLLFTTTTPAPTTRSPFDVDGIGQGINAFFQAFIKTNIQNIFRKGQDQSQDREVRSRSDAPSQSGYKFGDLFLNNLFRKP